MDWHTIGLLILIVACGLVAYECSEQHCLGADLGAIGWLGACAAFVLLVIHLVLDH